MLIVVYWPARPKLFATCYNLLMFTKLLVLTGAILAVLISFLATTDSYAATSNGDITVSGTVPTPPPENAPTIDQPTSGNTYNQKNITVSGRCDASLIVKIFSNGVFVGSTVCQNDGTYSLRIDLFIARNDLVARQYDSLNQASPDSNMVNVYYSPPPPVIPDTSGSHQGDSAEQPPAVAHFQLIIDYDYTVQSIFAGHAFRLPVKFMGGTGPYTVTIDWGEGSSNTFKRNNTNSFDTSFIYERPGTYIVSIKVNDASGQEAYLQFVVIVNGEPQANEVIEVAGRQTTTDITVLVVVSGTILITLAYLSGRYVSKKRKKTVDNKT